MEKITAAVDFWRGMPLSSSRVWKAAWRTLVSIPVVLTVGDKVGYVACVDSSELKVYVLASCRSTKLRNARAVFPLERNQRA